MANHRKLASLFPNSKLAKVVTTKANFLDLRERWLYSCLLWRYKKCFVSQSALAKWTGVDRTRTLPQILKRLRLLGLVQKHKSGKYRGVEPTEELMDKFVTWDNEATELEKSLAYSWAVYDPTRQILDNLVLAADATGKHAAAKLAKRFGVSRQTVARARKRNLERIKSPAESVTTTATDPIQMPQEPKPELQKNGLTIQDVHALLQPKPKTQAELSIPNAEPRPKVTRQQIIGKLIEYHGIPEGDRQYFQSWCNDASYLSDKELGEATRAIISKCHEVEDLPDYLIAKKLEFKKCKNFYDVKKVLGLDKKKPVKITDRSFAECDPDEWNEDEDDWDEDWDDWDEDDPSMDWSE